MRTVHNRYREYRVSLPADVAQEIKKIAAEHKLTEAEVVRKFVKLGLLAADIERNPSEELLISSTHGGMKELVVFGKVEQPVAA